jgi:hypothetical protein
MNLVVISGLITDLSDNIVPFLTKKTDIVVHTWDIPDNKRWIKKINRYKKYVNNVSVNIQEPKFGKKIFSYFYSTYKSVNLIENIDKYSRIIKFKPNLEGDIKYVGDLEYYFRKGYLQSYPLLKQYNKEDCIFGSIYHKTLDERFFTSYPLALKKAFDMLEEEFIDQMYKLDNELFSKYGENYEGSIFWTEWFERREVKLIQDIDLKLPHNKANSYGY